MKLHLHNFSKIKIHKEVTKPCFFLLFLPDDRRIRIRSSHGSGRSKNIRIRNTGFSVKNKHNLNPDGQNGAFPKTNVKFSLLFVSFLQSQTFNLQEFFSWIAIRKNFCTTSGSGTATQLNAEPQPLDFGNDVNCHCIFCLKFVLKKIVLSWKVRVNLIGLFSTLVVCNVWNTQIFFAGQDCVGQSFAMSSIFNFYFKILPCHSCTVKSLASAITPRASMWLKNVTFSILTLKVRERVKFHKYAVGRHSKVNYIKIAIWSKLLARRPYCIGNRFPLELSPGGFARPDTVSAATATTQVNTRADVSYTHSNHNFLVKA